MIANSDSDCTEQNRLERLYQRPTKAVRGRAREDAPADICETCITASPLEYDNPHDILAIRWMETAVTDALTAIQHAGYPNYPRECVENNLFAAYETAFFAACADPSECEICTHPERYDECGHERSGEPCPVPQRDGNGNGNGNGNGEGDADGQ